MDKLEQIRNRELAIHADIRFDSALIKKLNIIMKQVSSSGDTSYLTRCDRFFKYCNERDVWYGFENEVDIPFCSIDELNININMNGIKLITKERQEQIEKHNRTIEKDVDGNDAYQLRIGAMRLLNDRVDNPTPNGWNEAIWNKMQNKPTLERLAIAGALIAAEIDRIQNTPDDNQS